MTRTPLPIAGTIQRLNTARRSAIMRGTLATCEALAPAMQFDGEGHAHPIPAYSLHTGKATASETSNANTYTFPVIGNAPRHIWDVYEVQTCGCCFLDHYEAREEYDGTVYWKCQSCGFGRYEDEDYGNAGKEA